MARKKPVRCVETGEVFESMIAAGKSIGSAGFRSSPGGSLYHSHISHAIHGDHGHGGHKTAGGYHWEFTDDPKSPPKKLSVEELVDGLSIGDLITMGYENPNYTGRKRKKAAFKEDALPKIYKQIQRQPPKQQKVDYPPEGYVYVFRNRWHPNGIYKIGSTDNLEGRRSAARTWGPYDCEYYLQVKDCKLVESMVHEMLYDYRIDAGDLGKEHFSVDLEKATSIIKNVAFELACMHKDCAA